MNTLIKHTLAAFAALALAAGAYAQSIDANGTLTFPEGTKTIKNSAYTNSQSIKHIEFPASLESIGIQAFRYCVYIDDDLVLPEGLKTIQSTAFYNCINIHRITVPASVTDIGEDAFSRNTSLVVEENSYAHQWAVDNGYDYQFTAEGYPVGVTKMYRDFDVKTAWSQRGGYFQFIHTKERVLCGNLADAAIVFYNGWHYQGAESYATSKDVYYCDFDTQRPDYDKIPRTFLNSYTDEEMYDADLLLWQQCLAGAMAWDESDMECHPTNYLDRLAEHIPAKISTFGLKIDESDTGDFYKTREELEEMLIANCEHPFMAYAQSLGRTSNHGWVVDGLREKDGKMQIHCNFGWRGSCDGWYNVWDPIVNSTIDYQDPYRKFRFFVPFTEEELARWKPYTLTDEQKAAIAAETHNLPYIDAGTACLPEGTAVVMREAYLNNTDITGVKLPSTIRRINAYSFQGCSNIAELTIPASVEYINVSAFKGCTSLAKVSYNATNCVYGGGSSSAFNGCTNIAQVVIGGNVRSIPSYLFRYCDNLKEVEIPASVESIGTLAFSKATKIICPEGSYAEQWAIENGYKLSDKRLIKDSVLTLPEGMKEIAIDMYAKYTNINTLVIPSTVEKINSRAFMDCTNLQTVHFNAVASAIIGTGVNSAFYGCSNLKKVVVGEGVTTIPPKIFEQCTALETIELPASVFEINTKPFPKTTIVVCPEGSYAEKWAIENGYKLADEQLIKDSVLTLPEGMKEIATDMYAKYTNINTLVIPSTVEKINSRAFMDCTNLQTVHFNAVASAISGTGVNSAFYGCSNLKKVVVGEGVTTIPPQIFLQCTALETIELPASVIEINTNPFPKTTKVICPEGSYAEQWALANGYKLADEQLIKDSMLTLPEGLNEIAADIYANRTDFNALVIPSTVTKIDQRAFKNCTDLQTIYFNAILSSIAGEKGNAPFAGCTGLKKVVVGEGCTKISRTIFSQCTALDTIEIPASVTTIGDNPFPKTTTVVCPTGSYAEQWAMENGYTVVLSSADSAIDDHFAFRPIIVEGGHVSSTVGSLRIFNLLGQDVTHLNGSLRGIYIVRIGGEVMKVVVK